MAEQHSDQKEIILCETTARLLVLPRLISDHSVPTMTALRRAVFAFWILSASHVLAGDPLPGTQPLTIQGDIASDMIDGIDRFLLKQTRNTPATRDAKWLSFRQAASQLQWTADGHLSNIESTKSVTADASPLAKDQADRRQRLRGILGFAMNA